VAGKLRLVCLSAESADICARLGAWDDVVGVTAYADQSGRSPKPVISGFSKADVRKLQELGPDLAFTFSDVQAGITADLIRAGVTVLATNLRSIVEIRESIELIARAIDRRDEGVRLSAEFQSELDALHCAPAHRPAVYFEEWPEPMICGIPWVSELIDWCGGRDVFRDRRSAAAENRTVSAEEIVAANPDVILASWCGKPVNLDAIRARRGFETVSAVRNGRLHSIESSDILQPGPSLLRGARRIAEILTG
jgi:iron complex transport system substrate-binding protein